MFWWEQPERSRTAASTRRLSRAQPRGGAASRVTAGARRRARRARRRRRGGCRPCARRRSASASIRRSSAALGLAVVERREGLRELGCLALEADPRREALGGEASAGPCRGSRAPRRRSPRPVQHARRARPRRRRGPARSSSARRSDASSPASTSRSASLGTSPSKNRSTAGGGWTPTNSSTTWPSLNAFTAGMPWIWKAGEICWLASVSSFASTTSPSRARGGLLEDRRQRAARTAPLGPEVDDDRRRARALDDLLLEGRLGDVDDGHALR